MTQMHGFFTRQHEQLNRLETALVQTRTELESARTETLASLQAKGDQAAAARAARQQQIADGATRMKTRMEAKKQETAATIAGWKQRRELHKLDDRARSAEEYAEAATMVLNAAQEEARSASLEAVEARRVADEAKEAAGPTS
jgi:hypothetical protein